MIFKTQTIPPTDSIDLVEGISLLKTPTGMMFVLLFKILSNLLSHLFFNLAARICVVKPENMHTKTVVLIMHETIKNEKATYI